MLSTLDRIIFLKEVPFFQSMSVSQLTAIAPCCEEKFFEKGAHIFENGDPGGILFVVVNGRVAIEQEKRQGSFARLAEMEAYAYFGEGNFFDNSPRSTSALAIHDTLVLQLRREPVIELIRQKPDLAMQLINVLSQRLRESAGRVAEQTRAEPDALSKLYDQFS